jgi:hypothetical protein
MINKYFQVNALGTDAMHAEAVAALDALQLPRWLLHEARTQNACSVAPTHQLALGKCHPIGA